MTRDVRKKRRLNCLFLLGLVLFNYPILSLFNIPVFISGIPLLYLYLFSVWTIIIVIAAKISTGDKSPKTEKTGSIVDKIAG